jgi:hypothetical protein
VAQNQCADRANYFNPVLFVFHFVSCSPLTFNRHAFCTHVAVNAPGSLLVIQHVRTQKQAGPVSVARSANGIRHGLCRFALFGPGARRHVGITHAVMIGTFNREQRLGCFKVAVSNELVGAADFKCAADDGYRDAGGVDIDCAGIGARQYSGF